MTLLLVQMANAIDSQGSGLFCTCCILILQRMSNLSPYKDLALESA